MPETILPPRDNSQAPPPKAPESTLAQEKPQGESSIQKLKRQRAEFQQAARQHQEENQQLQARLANMEKMIQDLAAERNPKSPTDYPEGDLLNIATAPDQIEKDPATSMRAMATLLDKKIQNSSESVKEEVLQHLGKTFQERERQTREDQELAAQVARYGKENLQPGADLHDLAEAHYMSYLQRYGEDGKKFETLFKVMAIKAAAEELGYNQPRQSTETGPSPADRLETSGEGKADTEDEYKELLNQGKWREAMKLRSRNMFGG